MCLTEESSFIPSIVHTWHTSDKDCKKKWLLRIFIPPEAALYRSSMSIPKCDFNKVEKVTLLKAHFGMGVLRYICCIFSEHLFLRTPLEGCFCCPECCLTHCYHFILPENTRKTPLLFCVFRGYNWNFCQKWVY